MPMMKTISACTCIYIQSICVHMEVCTIAFAPATLRPDIPWQWLHQGVTMDLEGHCGWTAKNPIRRSSQNQKKRPAAHAGRSWERSPAVDWGELRISNFLLVIIPYDLWLTVILGYNMLKTTKQFMVWPVVVHKRWGLRSGPWLSCLVVRPWTCRTARTGAATLRAQWFELPVVGNDSWHLIIHQPLTIKTMIGLGYHDR